MTRLSRVEAMELRLHLASWLQSWPVTVVYSNGSYEVVARESKDKIHIIRSEAEADNLITSMGVKP